MKTKSSNVLGGAIVGLAITLMVSVVGCSKKTDDSAVPMGYGIAANCVNALCTTSSSISYVALSPQAQTALINYNNQYAGYDTSYWFRRSTLTPANYTNLLRDAMGVCNREYYNGGDANCSYWSNAAHVMTLSATDPAATTVNLNFWSTPYSNSSYNYSYQFPQLKYMLFGLFGIPIPTNPQAYYNPMPLQTNLWPINNSQGFEIRAYGPSDSKAQNQLLQFQVATGHIGDPSFSFVVYLNAVKISSGTMVLCQSPDCSGGW